MQIDVYSRMRIDKMNGEQIAQKLLENMNAESSFHFSQMSKEGDPEFAFNLINNLTGDEAYVEITQDGEIITFIDDGAEKIILAYFVVQGHRVTAWEKN